MIEFDTEMLSKERIANVGFGNDDADGSSKYTVSDRKTYTCAMMTQTMDSIR